MRSRLFQRCHRCRALIRSTRVPKQVSDMKKKNIYLALCLLGIVLPYWQFVPWVMQNGLNMPLFFQQLFANRIGAFFAMDVVASAITLMVFARLENHKLGAATRWLTLLAVLTVGVSLGLPLFLYLRELKLEEARSATKTATA